MILAMRLLIASLLSQQFPIFGYVTGFYDNLHFPCFYSGQLRISNSIIYHTDTNTHYIVLVLSCGYALDSNCISIGITDSLSILCVPEPIASELANKVRSDLNLYQ
jgi:hypothetical protein